MSERFDLLRMSQRRLNDEADSRPRQHQPECEQHRDGDGHHEHPILGERDSEALQPVDRTVELGRNPVRDGLPTPDHLHQLDDDVRQPEREQQLGNMAPLVHAPQSPALDHRADHKQHERRKHQRRPEADPGTDLVGDVSAEHVEARVREVQHAHHREDQRQARRQHEQQQSVADAVQRLADESLEQDRFLNENRPGGTGPAKVKLDCFLRQRRPLHAAAGRLRGDVGRIRNLRLPRVAGLLDVVLVRAADLGPRDDP